MRDDPTVVALVVRARDGDKQAWDQIVERYAPLVWSICVKLRLSRADADDVGQSVWLALVEGLAELREPAALPGWLATTTRRECLRHLHRAGRRVQVERDMSTEALPDGSTPADQELLTAERNSVLLEGLGQLDPRCRQLLVLLIQRPPVPYTKIGDTLGMPVEAIDPARAHCLDKLRRCPAVAVLIRTELEDGGERDADSMVER
jgi:RNA polymerase sigma factor (sigma-70 family)